MMQGMVKGPRLCLSLGGQTLCWWPLFFFFLFWDSLRSSSLHSHTLSSERSTRIAPTPSHSLLSSLSLRFSSLSRNSCHSPASSSNPSPQDIPFRRPVNRSETTLHYVGTAPVRRRNGRLQGAGSLLAHRQRRPHHEESLARQCQDRKRSQRNSAGMCIRVYLLHYKRR